jgi:hypothetical protein
LYDEEESYARLSAIRGAISDASDEFYRRVMVPYEEAKIVEHGDVVVKDEARF